MKLYGVKEIILEQKTIVDGIIMTIMKVLNVIIYEEEQLFVKQK